MIDTTWSEFSPSTFLPEGVAAVVDEIATTVEGLTAIVDIIADALDIAAAAAAVVVNLIEAALLAAVAAIEAAIEFLVATSVSVTHFIPRSYKNAPTVQGLLDRLAESMTDTTDEERPLGTSDNPFAMVTFIGVGPSIAKLQQLFEGLLELFGLPFEPDLPPVGSFFNPEFDQYPPKTSGGQGEAPNWMTYRLADLGFFGSIVSGLITARDALRPPIAGAELARAAINLIRARLRRVEDVLKEIVAIIGNLAALTVAKAGVHVLTISGTGSVDAQTIAIRTAAGDPDFPLKEAQDLDAAAAMVSLHAQFGSAALRDVFVSLFGAAKTVRDEPIADILARRGDVRAVAALAQEVNETALGDRRPGEGEANAIRKRWTPPEE